MCRSPMAEPPAAAPAGVAASELDVLLATHFSIKPPKPEPAPRPAPSKIEDSPTTVEVRKTPTKAEPPPETRPEKGR